MSCNLQIAIHVGNFHTTSDMKKTMYQSYPWFTMLIPVKQYTCTCTILIYTSFITNMHQSIAIGIEVNIYSNTKKSIYKKPKLERFIFVT